MPRPPRTWLVLTREVSHAAALPGNPALWATLIIDPETSGILGLTVQDSEPGAAKAAAAAAMSRTSRPGRQPPPELVLCAPGAAASIGPALEQAGINPAPPIHEVQPPAEAEDIFDSAVGHLAGRSQPADPAMPEDWEIFFAQGWAYREAEPWRRWSDTAVLEVTLTLPGSRQNPRYWAQILGQQGIQHGLVLSPGHEPPMGPPSDVAPPTPGAGAADAARAFATLPAGTLLFYLDPPEEGLPVEYRCKAYRYGWPADADLVPLFAAAAGERAADLGRDDVRRLTLALAAVTAHDARGLMRAGGTAAETTGGVPLGDGRPGRYAARTAPPREETPGVEAGEMLVLEVGNDLVTPGTAVIVGSIQADGLTRMREAASVHRPGPGRPPQGVSLPLVVLAAGPDSGDALAARVAGLDPIGVDLIENEGEAGFLLLGTSGAQLLAATRADEPAVAAFRDRQRRSGGWQVVLVADDASAAGEGPVYGLFECRMTPPAGASAPRQRAAGRKGAPRKPRGKPRRR